MFKQAEMNQIKKAISESIKKNEIAGANLLVIQSGEELLYEEAGFADKEEKRPIRRDSIFRLYSMSKPVTAAAVMILMERGEIDLFEPVSKYLPGFKNQMVEEGDNLVPVQREMTIKDLLSMTSGLVYGGNSKAGKDTEALFQEIDQRLFSASPMGTVEAMNKLGQCTLAFQPGAAWEYGTSADVLGALVEVISGMRFGEFLSTEIFQPLGMEDTGFWVPEEKRDRLVKTYEEDGQGGLKCYSGNHLGIIQRMDQDPAFESGGAGLVSTVDDYSKFAGMLLQGGSFNGVRILKSRTVNYFTSGSLTEEQQKNFTSWHTLCGYSYGNLMRVAKDCSKGGDLASLGEYGWDGWLGAYFCNCPKDDLVFLFMIQKTNAGTTNLTRKLRNIVFSTCCN
ncbi:MAG: beta-lactamase [Herbinix sp.]|jgi:CubicO group peptidase (beta-lactamase class C family)|nr:beta-lactamase [Herbinix sp.]